MHFDCWGILKTFVVCLAFYATALFAVPHEGLVEPKQDVLLGFPVAGRITKVLYTEGDRAEAGRQLIALDTRIDELEVNRRRIVFEDQTEVEAARAREVLLADDLASLRQLFDRTGSVSREELNRKELEQQLAVLAVQRLIIAKERERVEYDMAGVNLDQRQIKAPFHGVVAELLLQEGEGVSANQPVLRYVDDSICYLTLHIPSRMAAHLRLGQRVQLRFADDAEIVKTGEVAFISPVADGASGLRRVRMQFVNDAPRVVPGTMGVWMPEGTVQ